MFVFLLLVLPGLLPADYQSGLDAYNAGDYTNAMRDWKAVAARPPSPEHRAVYAETLYAIGMLYWQGEGVTRDYFEAAEWIRQAADLDHAGAQAKLGYLYSEGWTVEQDYAEAFGWFEKAARQGDVDGQYNLGVFYLNGWGVEQDRTMALQWLAAASAQGDEAAEDALEDLLPPATRPSADSGWPPESGQPVSESAQAVLDPAASGIHGAPWLMRQNPDHYTIQVIALSSRDKLVALIERHDYLAPFAIYQLDRNGRPLYVLTQGHFAAVEAARSAKASFPVTLNYPDRVWIRRFGKIQELIAAEGRDG